jgi:rubrerythrin
MGGVFDDATIAEENSDNEYYGPSGPRTFWQSQGEFCRKCVFLYDAEPTTEICPKCGEQTVMLRYMARYGKIAND